jgi:hypothetical protein
VTGSGFSSGPFFFQGNRVLSLFLWEDMAFGI